jgi:hypothetical protein
LSVFFDATGTTATATTRSFHDLEYRWNFGENQTALAALPGGTNWTNGSTKGSRNLATGPVAAHVFETPGTYTVALSATDGTNTANSCAQIVVQDPNTVYSGTNTICISSNTDPTPGSGGCPAGAAHIQQSDFYTAANAYIATGKRLLFKRGDTFSESATPRISVAGPGTIGAYGTGAKPIVRSTGNVPLLRLSSPSTPTVKDWRVMDIYFDGLSGNNTDGVTEDGGFDQFTLLRLDFRNVSYGFHTSGSLGDYYNTHGSSGHRVHSEYAIVDSTIVGMVGGYAAFTNGYYLAMMGNNFNDGTTTRFPLLVKSVISNNTLRDTTETKEVIKLHAPTACDSTVTPGCNYTNDVFPPVNAMANDGVKTFGYSEKIIISDNKLLTTAGGYMATFGAQNGNSDERTRDLILERNWLISSATIQQALYIQSTDTTVRNNICDVSASAYATCFYVGLWGIEPPPNNISIYNNTAYNGNPSASQFWFSIIYTAATNVKLMNNLAYAPYVSNPKMYSGTPGSGFVQSNNSSDAKISPQFVSPLTAPDGFKVAPSSYAVGTGAVVPVWSDIFSAPQTTTHDMGAVRH